MLTMKISGKLPGKLRCGFSPKNLDHLNDFFDKETTKNKVWHRNFFKIAQKNHLKSPKRRG